MGKKKRREKIISIDYDLGFFGIIPSKQKSDVERLQYRSFKLELLKVLGGNPLDCRYRGELFIFIIQFFQSEKEYKKRDVDNIAKTLLDVLEDGKMFVNDSQIRTLLVCKRIIKSIPVNFAYFGLKEIKNNCDNKILKLSGAERAISFYNELMKKK